MAKHLQSDSKVRLQVTPFLSILKVHLKSLLHDLSFLCLLLLMPLLLYISLNLRSLPEEIYKLPLLAGCNGL